MTGFAFAHVLKFKEFDQGPPKKNFSKGKLTEEEKKEEASKPEKSARLNLEHPYSLKYLNKVMLSQYTNQYYILDPARQDEDSERDFNMIVWVQMADDSVLNVDEMAKTLSEFGDYNVFKDSQNSFFLEFYFIEPALIPTQTVDEVI